MNFFKEYFKKIKLALFDCKAIYVFIFIGLLWVFHWITVLSLYPFEEWSEKDWMNKNMIEINGKKYSGWPISHLIMYFLLGLVCPKYWLIFFIFGVLWEIFEYVGGNILKKYKGEQVHLSSSVQYGEKWLDWHQDDIIFNILGLILGISVNYLIKYSKIYIRT